MDIKYKGISKDKIIEIQKLNMPRFGVPVIDDIDIMRENVYRINDCIDKIAKREARNQEIYIICEMAKLYLGSIKRKNAAEHALGTQSLRVYVRMAIANFVPISGV